MTIPRLMTGALAALVLAALLAVALGGLLPAEAGSATRASNSGSGSGASDDQSSNAGRGASDEDARRRDHDRETIIRLIPGDAYPSAHGRAKFKDSGGELELEIEAERLRGLVGAQLHFFVGGRFVGRALVDQFGKVALNLDSEDGDAVPASVSQRRVTVKTQDGTLVVGGFFP